MRDVSGPGCAGSADARGPVTATQCAIGRTDTSVPLEPSQVAASSDNIVRHNKSFANDFGI
jgi:hypothetical protein